MSRYCIDGKEHAWTSSLYGEDLHCGRCGLVPFDPLKDQKDIGTPVTYDRSSFWAGFFLIIWIFLAVIAFVSFAPNWVWGLLFLVLPVVALFGKRKK